MQSIETPAIYASSSAQSTLEPGLLSVVSRLMGIQMLLLLATLAVHDNGHGFAAAAVNGDQVGLQLMRERAEMLGGPLAVVSHAGGGTTVRLVAP